MLAHESLSYGPAGVRVQHSVPVQQAGPHAPVSVQAAIAHGVADDKLLCYFHRAFCSDDVFFITISNKDNVLKTKVIFDFKYKDIRRTRLWDDSTINAKKNVHFFKIR